MLLIASLDQSVRIREVESTIVSHYPDSIRSVKHLSKSRPDTVEKKLVQREEESLHRLYRYVESREIPQTTMPVRESLSHTHRLRYIYKRWRVPNTARGEDMHVDVHITFRTHTEGMRVTSSTSIEIELDKKYDTHAMDHIVQQIMTIHNGWHIPDTALVIDGMKDTIKILTTPMLQTPIDIAWKDITYDNLIAKPHAISFKADGVRMLLAMTPVGDFFITSSMDIIPLCLPSDVIGTKGVTVVDGELLKDRKEYWAFDLLMLDDRSYMDENLNVRRMMLSNARYRPDLWRIYDDLSIKEKPIIIPSTSDAFFTAMMDTDAMIVKEGIPSDGIILSGVNQPYSNPVYKWKPIDRLTVDFFIGPSNNLGIWKDRSIYVVPGITAINVPPISQGMIAEFAYVDEHTWRYVRHRLDKARPNAERVYLAIIGMHSDPITWDAITGQSLSLMRKYHNRTKRSVYERLSKMGIVSITDIGSGKGGDLYSWMNGCFQVTAIEPDSINVQDMLMRAQNMPDTTIIRDDPPPVIIQGECFDVVVHNMDAETYIDTVMPDETIQPDALTLFNSATFLGPSTVSTLAIQTKDAVVIMVMDGERLKDTFLGPEKISTRNVQIRPISSDGSEAYGDLGRIHIRLVDSATVSQGQDENLVDVGVLIRDMQKMGWVPTSDTILDGERLLGTEEAAYSSCQRLIVFRRAVVRDHIIRLWYTPLAPGIAEDIPDSPWGPVVRVGVLGSVHMMSSDTNQSFMHSIMQATSLAYQRMDNISKAVFVDMGDRAGIPCDASGCMPVYAIPMGGWDMYLEDELGVWKYPAMARVPRKPGVVIIYNRGQWEPLAKRDPDGILRYVW